MKKIKMKEKILPHRQTGIAILAVSFVVFATTFFALAQSTNNTSLFLDSDQDGLTDQEEHVIGTDPFKADTDGDGYSDGAEVKSGYDPLKPAPGDKIIAGASSSASADSTQKDNSANSPVSDSTAASLAPASSPSNASGQDMIANQTDLAALSSADPTNSASLAQLGTTDTLGTDAMTDLSSDPNNPNLTNEMIGNLMQLTKDKASASDTFANDPTFTSTDLAQVSQNALQTVDITKNLPVISDSELTILPEIKDSKLSADDIKAKQKTEIETYLAQVAFIFAANSPFPVESTSNLQSNVTTESTNLITALASGDKSKIDAYTAKAQTGIDQMKKVAVPYVLKDIHKSTLQLAMYTLSQKDSISLNTADPAKSLAAASSLQAVAQSAMDLQNQMTQILNSYGIDFINFPS